MADNSDLSRYLSNWRGEIDGVHLYKALSKAEKNADLAKVYAKLSESEEKHAQFWEKKIKEAGGAVPLRRQSFRSKALCWIAARFGPRVVLPTVLGMETTDQNLYDNQPEAKTAN